MTRNLAGAKVLVECIKIINHLPNPAMNIEHEKQIVVELTGCIEKLELVVESDKVGDEQKEQLKAMMERWRKRIAIAKERIEKQ